LAMQDFIHQPTQPRKADVKKTAATLAAMAGQSNYQHPTAGKAAVGRQAAKQDAVGSARARSMRKKHLPKSAREEGANKCAPANIAAVLSLLSIMVLVAAAATGAAATTATAAAILQQFGW